MKLLALVRSGNIADSFHNELTAEAKRATVGPFERVMFGRPLLFNTRGDLDAFLATQRTNDFDVVEVECAPPYSPS